MTKKVKTTLREGELIARQGRPGYKVIATDKTEKKVTVEMPKREAELLARFGTTENIVVEETQTPEEEPETTA